MSHRTGSDPGVGERIRMRRLLRGWSVRHAASRAGVSHASWSRIERGLQSADNRFTLAHIARALECSPAELTSSPGPAPDRVAAATRAAAGGLLGALVDIDLDEPDAGPAPALDELARTLELVDALRQDCDYAGVTRLLPALLRDLHVETAGPDRRRALRLLCEATFIASSVLRNLGLAAESWMGAQRCREAADATGEPLLQAYATYALASAAAACGAYQRSLTLAERALDDLHGRRGRPGRTEMLGSLQLVCARASWGRGRIDESRSWSAAAGVLARQTGETTTMGLFFGPTNVDIWQISIDCADDPARAAATARQANPGTVPAAFRQVYYYADTAHALARLGNDRDAVRFLLAAERVAPQHVRGSAFAGQTARLLLERGPRPELRALYGRLNQV